MNKILRTLTLASLVTAALTAASPLYAHQKAKPSMDHNMMMQGGKMGGMDMMGMMDQMNKMMGLCTKMMESKMDGGGHDTIPSAKPKKKS